MKQLLWLFLLLSANIMAAEEVYRWVDKKGVVNYSDKPKSATAKIVNLKESHSNTAIKSPVNLKITKKKSPPEKKILSAQDIEYCNYIYDQIKLAEENAKSFNELKASYAQAYLKASQNTLKDNNCI